MSDSTFSIGDVVQITHGSFAGVAGTVVTPLRAPAVGGTVILREGDAVLPHVTIAASVEGHHITLRVPPEILERLR